MRRFFTRSARLCGLALAVVLAGCTGPADELPRQAVSGTVTLDGQPLELGRIMLRPASAAEPQAAGAEIKNGTYRIPPAEGPTPGNYRVFITSSGKPAPYDPKKEKKPGLAVELIPPQYNIQTKLTAKVETAKENTINFTLSTAPASAAKTADSNRRPR